MDTISLFHTPLQSAPQLMRAGWGVHGVQDNITIESFRLPRLWCLHFYKYEAQLEIEGDNWDIQPGCVSLIPPDHRITYRFKGPSPHLYCHFSLAPSPENIPCPIAKFWYENAELPTTFQSDMETLVRSYHQGTGEESQKLRAQIALWELLWKLTELSPQPVSTTTLHPALQKALTVIDSCLGGSISVADLAREVGLSHNQLTRLFVRRTGRTIVAYIRHRRAERGRYLLENSTLPIKVIAAQVGTPDLGQFNHLMRGETGLSPRAHRAHGVGD